MGVCVQKEHVRVVAFTAFAHVLVIADTVAPRRLCEGACEGCGGLLAQAAQQQLTVPLYAYICIATNDR